MYEIHLYTHCHVCMSMHWNTNGYMCVCTAQRRCTPVHLYGTNDKISFSIGSSITIAITTNMTITITITIADTIAMTMTMIPVTITVTITIMHLHL